MTTIFNRLLVPVVKRHISEGKKMTDGALPNEKWSSESVELFNKLNGMSSDWKKLHRNMSVGTDGSKTFTCAVSEPGKFFEYAFFHNAKLQLIKAVVQFGSYTRGPPG